MYRLVGPAADACAPVLAESVSAVSVTAASASAAGRFSPARWMSDTGEDLRLRWAGGNAHDLGGSLGGELSSREACDRLFWPPTGHFHESEGAGEGSRWRRYWISAGMTD